MKDNAASFTVEELRLMAKAAKEEHEFYRDKWKAALQARAIGRTFGKGRPSNSIVLDALALAGIHQPQPL